MGERLKKQFWGFWSLESQSTNKSSNPTGGTEGWLFFGTRGDRGGRNLGEERQKTLGKEGSDAGGKR